MAIKLFNVKTDYSLLSSLIKIDDLINFCDTNNINECAICDTNLSSSMEFYTKAIKNKIKPIIGLEIMYDNNKIYLYAENYLGFKNLLLINTLKEKNEINLTNLIKYSNNVTCLLSSKSVGLYNDFKFYNNLYVGYTTNEEKVKALLLTNKVYYDYSIKVFSKEDTQYLEILNFIGGENNLYDNNHLINLSDDMLDEINDIFKNIDLHIEKEKDLIPVYTKNSNVFLDVLAKEGLKKRLNGVVDKKYTERLNYELEVINSMKFTDYFLIVYDYVLYAKKNNIYVGPGRGSAAGSLVCYSIGITDIDPLKYDLLFERFLNKDRISMPDIDIDFDSEKREEIIDYVRNKYGSCNVASGLTYTTFKSKLVLRDVGKILKIDNQLLEKFIKVIDRTKNLDENMNNEYVKKYLNNYSELVQLYKVSKKLENLKKNYSTHAAGIVICNKKLDEIIPVKITNGNYETGITMDYLEDIGILKMDFLGLKNLTTISNILKEIDLNNINDINLNDEKVINIFNEAETDGIFQYETYAMKNLLKKMKPKSFDEIVAAVALVRPGPLMFLDDYISNRDNIDGIKYIDNRLESILKETYGIILYQEQIIKILVLVGKFTNSEADLVRRAISKKSSDLLNSSRDKFIKGAINNNYDEKIANQIFEQILSFAGYGFNKSHSVAYALIAYQMAYLKVYYKSYFINEFLRSNKDRVSVENFLAELKKENVKIYKPDVNYSEIDFVLKDSKLMLPFSVIKNLNKDEINCIVNNKSYEDIFDFFIKNKDISKNAFDVLAYSNSFRSLKNNIRTLIENYNIIKNYSDLDGMLDKPMLKYYDEYDNNFLSEKEFELFGFYVGNHPASKYTSSNIIKFKNIDNNLFKNIYSVAIVHDIKKIKTKKGDDMAFLKISDETDKVDAVVFSDKINLLNQINKNDLVSIRGKITKSQDKVRVVVNDIKKGVN